METSGREATSAPKPGYRLAICEATAIKTPETTALMMRYNTASWGLYAIQRLMERPAYTDDRLVIHVR